MNLPAGETRRIHLDQTSWIEHTPGWLGPDQAEELLVKLIASAACEQRDRWMASRRVIEPRLTAEYTDLADTPDPALREAADALSAQYKVPYDGPWVNFYRDYRDSLAVMVRRELVGPPDRRVPYVFAGTLDEGPNIADAFGV